MDCVLESKICHPLMMTIIFQSVARRLGVRCDLVKSSLGYLCWKPKSIAENSKDEKCFYIDFVNDRTIRGRNYCPIESYNKHKKLSLTEMVSIIHYASNFSIDNDRTQRRVELLDYVYIESDGLNIDCIYYNPMNISDFLLLCQASLQEIQNNYNRKFVEASRRTTDIFRTFEMSVQCMNANLQIVPKNRTKNIKYAVGMIVTCIENDVNQTGVIIGWDEEFYAPNPNIKYKSTIVFKVSQIRALEQPFYVILTEDNICYAAQDTLIKTRPRRIEHSEIGRYFCRFTNIYYVPNEALTKRYPYDQAINML